MKENNLEIIVTGTGRCGTKYVSELFKSAGKKSGHEAYFSLDNFENNSEIEVDSSWLAAPFLESYRDKKIIHLVRNPVDVIASLLKLKFFSTNFPRTAYYTSQHRWTKYAYEQLPDLEYYKPEKVKCMVFYYYWNKKIEELAGDNLVRFRLEDIVKDPQKFLDNFGLKLGSDFNKNRKFDCVGHRKFKSVEFTIDRITEGALKDLLLKQVEIYGYKF